MDAASTASSLGREVCETKVFTAHGTFTAIADAKGYLEIKNFVIGSMQRTAPIGFMDATKCCGVSKWRNMTHEEHCALDGVILSDDFREGDVTVVFFKLGQQAGK